MTTGAASGGRSLAPSVAGASGLAALVLLVGARVATAYPDLLGALWSCSLKSFFGIPCLTCGLTRVLLMLSVGDVLGAFALAPLPALLVVLALLLGAWHVVARLGHRLLPDEVLGRWLQKRAVRWGLFASVVALWTYAIVRSLYTGAP